jgi:hypothetical protein
MSDASDTNPKAAFGRAKPGISCIPPIALIYEGEVMKRGAEKYGAYNWQGTTVDCVTYYDAMMRHLMLWYTGQDNDIGPGGSGLPHLAHVRACAGIILDADESNKLYDNRPPTSDLDAVMSDFTTTPHTP